MKTLPKILKREPLVDAIFEVRTASSPPLADILPGILFHELEPKPSLMRLPVAEIPKPMRDADPALRYSPTQRLIWGQYVIGVGDHNVVISCKLPYPRWPAFKKTILNVIAKIADIQVAGNVERFSLKYVNLIQAPSLKDQIAKIDLAVRVGEVEVIRNHIDLKVHHLENDTLHILTVITGTTAQMIDGTQLSGVIVDIDSIRNLPPTSFEAFAEKLEPELETLRQSNKVRFFDCLKSETIEEMGPVYE